MKNYDDHDKKTVEELRTFIKDKNGKDFNKYFDTFSLTRIAFNYLYQVSQKSDTVSYTHLDVYKRQGQYRV